MSDGTITGTEMVLPKQFLISADAKAPFLDWQQKQVCGRYLAYAPELSLIVVTDGQQVITGYLLGWVIYQGRLLADGDRIVAEVEPARVGSDFDELCGRFIYLYESAGALCVVTDAGGLLPLVFSKRLGLAASSPAVLAQVATLTENRPARQRFSREGGPQWFPFATTPYEGVTRLLPNHRLSLGTWQCERIYPVFSATGTGVEGSLPAASDGEANSGVLVSAIATAVRTNMRALVHAGHNCAHLTAGCDSRMVLAAAHGLQGDMEFHTVDAGDAVSGLDSHTAVRLAEKFQFRQRPIPFIEPTVEQRRSWLARTGHCIDDAVSRLTATVERYESDRHVITGTCGEVARAYYWHAGDSRQQGISVDELLVRMKITPDDFIRGLAQQWLAPLERLPRSTILDLAYIEQRLGCWAGPAVYGHRVPYPSLSPFNSRGIYTAILALPAPYREQGRFVQDFIGQLWPELLQLPFNRASGLARLRFLRAELRALLPSGLRIALLAIKRWLRHSTAAIPDHQQRS